MTYQSRQSLADQGTGIVRLLSNHNVIPVCACARVYVGV